MEIYDFPEYCPDSDSTADQEQNAVLESKFTLWSEHVAMNLIDHIGRTGTACRGTCRV